MVVEAVLGEKKKVRVSCAVTNTGPLAYSFKVGGAIYNSAGGMVMSLLEITTESIEPGRFVPIHWEFTTDVLTKVDEYGVSVYVKDAGVVLDKEPKVGVLAGLIRIIEPAKPMADVTDINVIEVPL